MTVRGVVIRVGLVALALWRVAARWPYAHACGTTLGVVAGLAVRDLAMGETPRMFVLGLMLGLAFAWYMCHLEQRARVRVELWAWEQFEEVNRAINRHLRANRGEVDADGNRGRSLGRAGLGGDDGGVA